MAALTQKLDKLLSVGQSLQSPSFQGVCALCFSPAHFVSNCPTASQIPEFVQEQVNAAQWFSKLRNYLFSNTYNPGWRNHHNFAWKSPGQGTSSYQPQRQNFSINYIAYHSQQSYKHPNPYPPQRNPSFEETVLKKLKKLKASTQLVHSHSQSIAKVETQIGQIANTLNRRDEGRLPSQPSVNPKNTFEWEWLATS